MTTNVSMLIRSKEGAKLPQLLNKSDHQGAFLSHMTISQGVDRISAASGSERSLR